MAATLFSLRVTVENPKETRGLDNSEKRALFARPITEPRKRREAGSVARAVLEEVKPADKLSLEDISLGYQELIAKAGGLLERLRERVGDLTYTFVPENNPELAQSIADLYVGERSRITYTMYLNALKLDKDLAITIGEASHGAQ